jgi:hypothetical protein
MSNEITAWVVSVTFHEQALTEINEVSNHFTRAGFVLTLNDEEGTPHELGTNTFGLLSAQDAEEVKALSAGLAERPWAARRNYRQHIRRVVKSSISAFSATESVSCASVPGLPGSNALTL